VKTWSPSRRHKPQLMYALGWTCCCTEVEISTWESRGHGISCRTPYGHAIGNGNNPVALGTAYFMRTKNSLFFIFRSFVSLCCSCSFSLVRVCAIVCHGEEACCYSVKIVDLFVRLALTSAIHHAGLSSSSSSSSSSSLLTCTTKSAQRYSQPMSECLICTLWVADES